MYIVYEILGAKSSFFARNCGRSCQKLPENVVGVDRTRVFSKKRGPRIGPLRGVLTDVVAKSKVYPGELKVLRG